ncbi:MAG: helix-turn-helix domain-containing protein [Ignavibacteriales bacterium]
MRVGSIVRLIRLSLGSPLRGFAKHTGIPHATLSAIESGWVFPTPEHLRRVSRTGTPWATDPLLADYMWGQMNRERVLRQLHDPPIYPLNLVARRLLRDFLDDPPIPITDDYFEMILSKPQPPACTVLRCDSHVASTLQTLIRQDLQQHGHITPLTKLRLVFWRGEYWVWVRPEDAHQYRLTQPSPKASRLWSAVTTEISRVSYTPSNLVERLTKNPPDMVPDSFAALDILLLLSTAIHLDPLKPGELGVSFVSARGKQYSIVAQDNGYLASNNTLDRICTVVSNKAGLDSPQTSPPEV